MGRHSVKAGFGVLHLRYLNRSYFETMGDFTFSGIITGNAAADFLLGKAQIDDRRQPRAGTGRRADQYLLFVQDDWKVTPRLTLNLGLRYELPLPWVHPQDEWGTLHVGQQSTVIPTAPAGHGVSRRREHAARPGAQPTRITSRRASASPGIRSATDAPPFAARTASSIETVNSDIIQNTSQPYRYTFTFNPPASLVDPLRGQPPIPLGLNLKNPSFVGLQQIFYPDPTLRSPYVQQFNLNVQRQIWKDLQIQAGYFGKLGRNLLLGLSPNPALPAPGATLANENNRRILPCFGNNSEISSEANSSYNALQVEVNKRFSHNFSVQGAYTFSRSIDDGSAFSLGAAVPNVFNLHSQWALSDFYAKHIASFSWIWDLPRLTGYHAALRFIGGGWQVNGLVSMRSGTPINVLTGADNALTGNPSQRPDVVGNPVLPGGRSTAAKIAQWFNPAAFAAPAANTYGNAGRNALLGPTSHVANLALFKTFPIPVREGMQLQFRSEFFNVLNAVNFSNPNATLGASMGRITGTDSARVIQFALKLLF